jgi:2-phosphosulfolactate phosphatase
LQIHTISHRGQIINQPLRDAWAVVIDILRFTTTVSTALCSGALRVYPAGDEDEARSMAKKLSLEGECLLCGEVDGLPLPGFDLGNSPLEYTPENVNGKTIVTMTTNGTGTIRMCRPAARILAGGFVNVSALVHHIIASDPSNLYLVCSGQRDSFCLEDYAFAGYLARQLFQHSDSRVMASPETLAACRVMGDYEGDTLGVMRDCSHGKYLSSIGFAADQEACAQIDVLDVVPRVEGGYLIAEPPISNENERPESTA